MSAKVSVVAALGVVLAWCVFGIAWVIMVYGVQIFFLPAWALATGAACVLLTMVALGLLRPSPALDGLVFNAFFVAKIAAIVITVIGAVAAGSTYLLSLDVSASAYMAALVHSQTDFAPVLAQAVAWGILFIAPLGFALVSLGLLALDLFARIRNASHS